MNDKSFVQALVTPLLIVLAFAAGFFTDRAITRSEEIPAQPTVATNDTSPSPAPQKSAEPTPSEPAAVESTPLATAPKPAVDVWPARHLFIEVDGQWLSQPAKDFIHEIRPGGVLLRTENIDTPSQTLALVREIKEAAGLGRRQMSDLPIVAIALTERATFDMLGPSPIATLASATSLDPARELGKRLAAALKERGINAFFGPVLDVGVASPIDAEYATRVISTDRIMTTAMGLTAMDELLRDGVLCAATTYPGYSAATHAGAGGLVLTQDTKQLAELLYPFSAAASHGVPGIVVAHVAVPAVDKEHPKRPASQSSVLVKDVLRGLWSYDGVVIADDVTSVLLGPDSKPGAAAVNAIASGCDAVIVGSADVAVIKEVCGALTQAVVEGKLAESVLKEAARRLDTWTSRLESPSGLQGVLPDFPGNLLKVAKAQPASPDPSAPAPTVPPAQADSPVPIDSTTPMQFPETGKLEDAQGEYKAVQAPAGVTETAPPIQPERIEPKPTEESAPAETVAPPTPEKKDEKPTSNHSSPEPPASTEIHPPVVPAAIGDPTIVPDVKEVAPTDAESKADADAKTGEAPPASPPTESAPQADKTTETPPKATDQQPAPTPAEPTTPTVEKPAEEVSAPLDVEITHMVLPGETIVEIANRYGVQATDIQSWNELSNLNVEFGKTLKLRVKPDVAERISAEEAQRPPADFQDATHVVTTGETLTSIAATTGVEIRDLVRWNGLTDSKLQAGRELKIYKRPEANQPPVEKPTTTTYQVKKGDTLTQIGKRFGVAAQEILDANHLDNPNKVVVGQKLAIPVKQ